MLRSVFLSHVSMLIAGGVVALIFAHARNADPPLVVAEVVLLSGMASLGLERLVERPLDCRSTRNIASAYRQRFFLRAAFSESAALFGFVGAFVAGHGWIYLTGLFPAVVGFGRLAPTSRHLERDQQMLAVMGCHRNLRVALKTEGGDDNA
jgi:hypothetical protein